MLIMLGSEIRRAQILLSARKSVTSVRASQSALDETLALAHLMACITLPDVTFSPSLKVTYKLWRFPENILSHVGIVAGAPLSLLLSEEQVHLRKDLQFSCA